MKVIFFAALFLSISSCITAKAPEYSYEFPERFCEEYSATESNSAVRVCRSQYHENRFLLERRGFAVEPKTREQDTRRLIDWVASIAAIAGGGGTKDGIHSAHYQNPDRWEQSAQEYVRSRYGPGATIRYFENWRIGSLTDREYDEFFTFEVLPDDLTPPWGNWHLKRRRVGGVEVETLDDY